MDDAYVRRAIDAAREAAAAGNPPFGSLLVVDGDVVRTAENTARTDDDITAHPELTLARWAARELDRETRAACTMYTSTEPCVMCAAAIHYARLGRVVYSVAWGTFAAISGYDELVDIRCAEVIERGNGVTEVDGPVLEDEGREILEATYS